MRDFLVKHRPGVVAVGAGAEGHSKRLYQQLYQRRRMLGAASQEPDVEMVGVLCVHTMSYIVYCVYIVLWVIYACICTV
jgi:hypothetical protein